MKNSPVRNALQIRAGAVTNSRYLAVAETGTFGLSVVENDTPYYFQEVPLPTMVSYQTQAIVALQMTRELNHVVKAMKRKLFAEDNRKAWFELFLTVFILLTTVEYVYQKQRK